MDAMGGFDAASTDDRGDRLPGCGRPVGGHLGSQDVGFNQEGRTMNRIALCMAAVLVLGLGMSSQETRADDDLQFATPAVAEAGTAAACEAGTCQTTRFARTSVAYHRSRRPIARWFQEHRPVRRVLRGAVRFFGRRCCH